MVQSHPPLPLPVTMLFPAGLALYEELMRGQHKSAKVKGEPYRDPKHRLCIKLIFSGSLANPITEGTGRAAADRNLVYLKALVGYIGEKFSIK